MIQSTQSPTFLQPARNVQLTSSKVPELDVEMGSVASDIADLSLFSSLLSHAAWSRLSWTDAVAGALQGKIGDYVPGEVIVRTKPNLFVQQGQSNIADYLGATIVGEFDTYPPGMFNSDGGQFLQLKLPAGMNTEKAMAILAKDDTVAFAVPNNIFPLPDAIDEPGGFSAKDAATPNVTTHSVKLSSLLTAE